MAIALTTLVEDAERYLGASRISDYCPNGLQVEGRPQVPVSYTHLTLPTKRIV